MDWLVKLAMLALIANLTTANTWVDPFIEDAGRPEVVLGTEGETISIKLDEEQANIPVGILTGVINGMTMEVIGLIPPTTEIILGLTMECTDENCLLIVNNSIDYDDESSSASYLFDIVIGAIKKSFKLDIINIDDRPPVLSLIDTCSVTEETGVVLCDYLLKDDDGMLDVITFDVQDYKDLFKFNMVDPPINQFEANVRLELLVPGEDIDYEKKSLYIVNLVVQDGGPTPVNVKVIIEVIDIANKPPRWVNIFYSEAFDEHTPEQTFEVYAIDRDTQIDEPINYKLIFPTSTSGPNWEEFITIDKVSGLITVKEIDREGPTTVEYFKTNTDIKFEIIAYEAAHEDVWSISASSSFIIIDIDDNRPEITLNPKALRICENKNDALQLDVAIEDLDNGDNARYNVELKEKTSGLAMLRFIEAFQIIPSSGFQKLGFLLNIVKYELLDYESDGWKEFSYLITSQGLGADPAMKDEEELKFELIDWNDEKPIFTKDNYEETLPESIKKGDTVVKVEASDRDRDGDGNQHPMTFEVQGSMKSQVEISNDGLITTLKDGFLDFEMQEQVTFQVIVTDTFPNPPAECDAPINRVTTTVTINVVDVNDEKPSIVVTIVEPIQIEENTVAETVLDLGSTTIHATDADVASDLKFEILWEESSAFKSGMKVDNGLWHECLSIGNKAPTPTDDVYAEFTVKGLIDYELFDSLDLYVQVEDMDQLEENGPTTDKVLIRINIIDVNDNPPLFIDSPLEPERVMELAKKGSVIGRVLARDIDSDLWNKFEYSIIETGDTTPGLVIIDKNSGDIMVAEDGLIEADPDIEALHYKVEVHDLYNTHQDNKMIKIDIIDENDNPPVIVDTVDKEMDEEVAEGTHVYQIDASDFDRDEPHKVMTYQLDTTTTGNFFNINDKGEITIRTKIDRDANHNTNAEFNLKVIVKDFPGGNGFTEETFLKVVINDINDNKPIIQTSQLEAKEDLEENVKIGDIKVMDSDAPGTPNSEITLEILTITNVETGVDVPGIFAIGGIVQDGQTSTVTFNVGATALKGNHGSFAVKLEAKDSGSPALSSDPTVLTVVVDKVNFQKPTFTFPKDDNKVIYLRWEDDLVGKSVKDIYGVSLEMITAKDEQEKYKVSLKMEHNDGVEIFKIINESPAELIVNLEPVINIAYKVTFTANNVGGLPLLPSEREATFMFVDVNEDPKFKQLTYEGTILEGEAVAQLTDLPKAYYTITEIAREPFYQIRHDIDDFPFEIDANTGVINLLKVLDREDIPFYVFNVVASQTAEGIPSPHPDSILEVTIIVGDINDNKPNFQNSPYYHGITTASTPGEKLFQALAFDPDTDELTYTIEKTVSHGDLTTATFIIDADGYVSTTYKVPNNVLGYFELTLKVWDGGDGNEHEDIAQAKVYVVTAKHRVEFKFSNIVGDVETKREKIKEILESKEIFDFNFVCNVESILPEANSEGNPNNEVTIVAVHFIDIDENDPLERENVMNKLNEVKIYGMLRGLFYDQGLNYISFVEDLIFPDDSETLRAWLIGVSVVLGSLLALMIVAYIFKVRSLTMQIKRLFNRTCGSQDSQINRTAAPTTNQKTFDGSNPVFVNEKRESVLFPDNASMRSGDSELVGVENDPVFSNSRY